MLAELSKMGVAMTNSSITDPPNAEEEAVKKLFQRSSSVTPHTFEIGLVLGGTVSAGAYTAGVLDFLFEALDCWEAARNDGKIPVPKHRVELKVITGTSGGGVNAAIAARALAYQLPPVRKATSASDAARNPFYDTWINTLDLNPMLDTRDFAAQREQGIKRPRALSLLDATVIDDGGKKIIGYAGSLAPPRRYLAQPLPVILTLTNLRGVPYRTRFAGAGPDTGEVYVDHADYARFAAVYSGAPPPAFRPDEFPLTLGDQEAWTNFSRYARGTAAFPVGFPARDLERPLDHYRYRAMLLPGEGEKPARIVPLRPEFSMMGPAVPPDPLDRPGWYRFPVVDGGATDNEPIELARTELAGLDGRNPRDGDKANRAVLLIDPFAGNAKPGPPSIAKLVDEIGPLMTGMIQQTRYDSSDMMLALDDKVFSRFMICARRAGKVGDAALATAGLGAFIGFASPAFRRHDYLLGRKNCQHFLRNDFMLPADAELFKTEDGWDGWLGVDREAYLDDARNPKFLPIIPLIGAVRSPEEIDDWPKCALDPEIYRDGIENRFVALVDAEGPDGWASGPLAHLAARWSEGSVADFVIGAMRRALVAAELI